MVENGSLENCTTEAPRADGTEPLAEPPLQFSLRAMLATVTAIAAGLAVCVQLGMLGAVIVWLAAAGFTFVTWKLNSTLYAVPRMLLWGVAMPIVCLAFDPGIFRNDLYNPSVNSFSFRFSLTMAPDWRAARWEPQHLLVYAYLCYQMIALTIWALFGKRLVRGASLLAGTFWPGVLCSALLGIVLALPGLFALPLAGIGLLAWTPILTADVFRRARRAARDQSVRENSPGSHRLWAFLGFIGALLLPWALAFPFLPLLGY